MTATQPLAYLNRVHPIQAPFRIAQATGISWLMQAISRTVGSESQQRIARALDLYERLLSNEALQTRYTVLDDYTHTEWDKMRLYRSSPRQDASIAPWYAPPLENRMALYAEHALEMARAAFPSPERPPSYIIEVSCTGYQAPYTAQQILMNYQWQDHTRLLKLGHMGCYASLPALHLASQLLNSTLSSGQMVESPTISVFSVELCTLHLRPQAAELDQMIANMLFADGAARFEVSSTKTPQSLALLGSYESIIPDSAQLMEWKLCDSSFSMVLSRKVSTKIAEELKKHLDNFLLPRGLTWRNIQRFAIHPGGPKIIDTIQNLLELNEQAVQHSRTILAQFGNMSSSTLPYIWDALQNDPRVKPGELILSMAFGPGLTLTMNLMQKGV